MIPAYDGQYCRIDITAVASPDDLDKAVHASWCSEAFKELKQMPSQTLSRFITGPPLPKYDQARRHAYNWIKTNWDVQKVKRPNKARDAVSVTFTVWLFKGHGSLGFDLEEFSDAKLFAKTAEKSVEITKVGITNNESPEPLIVLERETQIAETCVCSRSRALSRSGSHQVIDSETVVETGTAPFLHFGK